MPSSARYPGRQYRVLVVDDHPIVRHGLKELIDQEPDLCVCGEAASVGDALELVRRLSPDVVIVDISLEGSNGIELIEAIHSQDRTIKMLVSSIHDEMVFAGRALRAGAMGYVCKREAVEKIVAAVRQVLRGEIYLSPRIATRFLHRAAVGEPLEDNPVQILSNRELEVFEMIGQGMTMHQIARKLGLSPKTVETHRKNIKTKLNFSNSMQLSRCAFQWVHESR